MFINYIISSLNSALYVKVTNSLYCINVYTVVLWHSCCFEHLSSLNWSFSLFEVVLHEVLIKSQCITYCSQSCSAHPQLGVVDRSTDSQKCNVLLFQNHLNNDQSGKKRKSVYTICRIFSQLCRQTAIFNGNSTDLFMPPDSIDKKG